MDKWMVDGMFFESPSAKYLSERRFHFFFRKPEESNPIPERIHRGSNPAPAPVPSSASWSARPDPHRINVGCNHALRLFSIGR